MPAELTNLTDGVARIRWGHLTENHVEQVRESTEAAFAAGIHRVEAWVATGDEDAMRVVTFAGMRREGIARGLEDGADRIIYARLADDPSLDDPRSFRALLNSFLPRKRAIGQLLIRDHDGRVLMCELTYKRDHDLPGGVVEINESPQLAVSREVEEELALKIDAGRLLLTDWLPPWSGWDDAVCLVFDGGVHDATIADHIVRQVREIKSARFQTIAQIRDTAADFTARRIEAALRRLDPETGDAAATYTESGRG